MSGQPIIEMLFVSKSRNEVVKYMEWESGSKAWLSILKGGDNLNPHQFLLQAAEAMGKAQNMKVEVHE